MNKFMSVVGLSVFLAACSGAPEEAPPVEAPAAEEAAPAPEVVAPEVVEPVGGKPELDVTTESPARN